jgi:hypothetical protein
MIVQSKFFKPVFLIALFFQILAFLLKFEHVSGLKPIMVISLLLMIVYIIIALYEILGSSRIGVMEKLMWTICFVVPSISLITGLLYFFLGRPRILRVYKVLSR